MQQLVEIGYVDGNNGLEMSLGEMLKKKTSGCNDNGESEKAVIETLPERISKDGVQIFSDFIRAMK